MTEQDPYFRHKSLQEVQDRFDRDRDLDFEHTLDRTAASASDTGFDRWLHNLEFAILALAGEVGELANLVKKARRQLWRAEPATLDLPAARSELADILSYTLKFANLA